jgi:hypothetical protein
MPELKKIRDTTATRVLRAACAFLGLLLIAGCGTIAWDTSAVVQPRPSGYLLVLEEWTRSKDVYEGFESRLFVRATYKSLPFREAYIDEYAEKYRIDEDLKRVLMEREVESFQTYNEFFISAGTPVDFWNDFDQMDSLWKLYLEDDVGRKVEPVDIRKVEAQDQRIKAFFPYLNYWSIGYIVKFPKHDATGEVVGKDASSLRLVLTGVIGQTELEWGLER